MQNLDSLTSDGTKMFYFTDEVQSAIEQVSDDLLRNNSISVFVTILW